MIIEVEVPPSDIFFNRILTDPQGKDAQAFISVVYNAIQAKEHQRNLEKIAKLGLKIGDWIRHKGEESVYKITNRTDLARDWYHDAEKVSPGLANALDSELGS